MIKVIEVGISMLILMTGIKVGDFYKASMLEVHLSNGEISHIKINKQITAPEVRVVSEEEQIGVLTISEAIELAADRGLDLIEISPKAKPPVCKIIDYGKFKYQQNKKAKENKKASTKIVVREIRMKVRIGQHDLELKARNAMKFLAAGNKVRVSVMFRAREITHPEIGQELLEKFLEMVKDQCLIEKSIAMEGRTLVTTLAPL